MIDGEGYIGMVKRKNLQLARRVAVTSTSLPLLVQICEWFGGKIHAHTSPPARHRQQFQWYVSGDLARALLHGVLPYLIVKQEEATLYLAFDGRRGPERNYAKLQRHERAYREELLTKVQAIRHREYSIDQVPAQYTSKVLPIRV